jgi:hypothetical protein
MADRLRENGGIRDGEDAAGNGGAVVGEIMRPKVLVCFAV